ncbi:MAG: carbohydrate ABC transporter permease [Nitrososphaeria archaeon]
MKKKIKFSSLLLYISVIIFTAFLLFPIFWMVLSSFLPEHENPFYGLSKYTLKFTLENYFNVFMPSHWMKLPVDFVTQLKNSVFIAIVTSLTTLGVAAPGAYSLSRLKFRGIRLASASTLFVYIIPASFLVIPFFVQMSNYNIIDSPYSVILAMTVFTMPYSLWILRSYFSTIPKEIEESALIDGASRIKILFTIILPISTPTIVAVATYVFVHTWNEYLYALTLLTRSSNYTLPLGITGLVQASDIIPWGLVMAQSVLYAIPPIIFYYTFQKYMVKGIMAGALKY